jgi:hypothetical protein
MLISIDREKWEEIKEGLELRGKLQRTIDRCGQLVYFPEAPTQQCAVHAGGQN